MKPVIQKFTFPPPPQRHHFTLLPIHSCQIMKRANSHMRVYSCQIEKHDPSVAPVICMPGCADKGTLVTAVPCELQYIYTHIYTYTHTHVVLVHVLVVYTDSWVVDRMHKHCRRVTKLMSASWMIQVARSMETLVHWRSS